MSRSGDRQLERRKPFMWYMIRAARGSRAARMAVDDELQETGIHMASTGTDDNGREQGRMMIAVFQVGVKYWYETPNWVYVGECLEIGADYVMFGQSTRMPTDGRHSTMMKTGTAPNIEFEPSGGPKGEMYIPIDWMGPFCEWPFDIPANAV